MSEGMTRRGFLRGLLGAAVVLGAGELLSPLESLAAEKTVSPPKAAETPKTYYDIQVGAFQEPFNANNLLAKLHNFGDEIGSDLFRNAYLTPEYKTHLYKVVLPSRKTERPDEVLTKVKSFGYIDAFIVESTFKTGSEEAVKKEAEKTTVKVKKDAEKTVRKAAAELKKKTPVTKMRTDLRQVIEPLMGYIQKKHYDFSKERLSDEKARQYILSAAKWADYYKVPQLDLFSILIHETRFVDRQGDNNNFFRDKNGNLVYNPSESLVQMGRLTQVDVYNRMLRDKEAVKATRNIRIDWGQKVKDEPKSTYDYLKSERLINYDFMPDVANNPDIAIRFAAKYFRMCIDKEKGNIDRAIGHYNAGLGGNNPSYSRKVKAEKHQVNTYLASAETTPKPYK